jgi:hypothetical protein
MKRIIYLLLIFILTTPVFAAGSKSYSVTLPAAGLQRSPVVLRTAFNDVLSWINGIYDNTGNGDTQFQVLTSNGDGSFIYENVIRSNVDLLHTDGNGSVGQALISNGDGTTKWATTGILTDGDKGDITVSNSGTVWEINNGSVVTDKIGDSNITEDKINNGAISTVKLANGSVTLTKLGTDGYPITTDVSTINFQTGTTYTIQNGDNGRIVAFSNGSAITATIPDTVPNNFTCTLMQLGNGTVTIDNGGSLVLRNSQDFTTLLGRWSTASVIRVSNGNDLVIFGDLAP